MNQEPDLQGGQTNSIPDLVPVEIPGQVSNPSIEDRLAEIESVLNIN